jgi:hypothetical protein
MLQRSVRSSIKKPRMGDMENFHLAHPDVILKMGVKEAQHNSGARTRQPSLLAGMLFDGDGNRMTPSHAVKNGTRYRYYVSHSLITKDRTEDAAGLRIPAAEVGSS